MNEDNFIALSVPNLTGNELQYVTNAIEMEWVSTAGPYVDELEKQVAKYVGTPKAVACQSGTAGIHMALLLCGVAKEDMVIVPTLTFIAAVNPVKYIGAEPIFMDCDDSLCMDPFKLEDFCVKECETRNKELYHKKSGRKVKALVVVHVFGNMADMEMILDIATRFHIKVVEDATEALGTKYTEGKYTDQYAGTMGDVGVFSFNGNKIITTGGGGMIVSQDEELLSRAKHLTTQAKVDEVNFFHDEIGYNYRLTNLQAALGIAQMERLEEFIETKKRNYEYYKDGISEIQGLSFLGFKSGVRSNCWFYSLYLEKQYSRNVMDLIAHLKKNMIQSRPIWGLIHDQLPYKECDTYRIEKAIEYWKCVVNIPCSTNLTYEDIDRVLTVIKE